MASNNPAASTPDRDDANDSPSSRSAVRSSTRAPTSTRAAPAAPPPPPASSSAASSRPASQSPPAASPSSNAAVKSSAQPPAASRSSQAAASNPATIRPPVNPFSAISSNPPTVSNPPANGNSPASEQARVTSTSTIVDVPVSTFSKPVSVTLTNSAGQTSVSAPPFVTVLSTSTQADGSFVTYTHVIANPTGFASANQAVTSPSVLTNRGAMAGIFITVGIVAAALTAAICFITRRRRRQRRRQEWFNSIGRPQRLSDSNAGPLTDPFHDPFRDPPTFTGGPVSTGRGWPENTERNLLDDEVPSPVINQHQVGSPGLAGVGAMRVVNPVGPHQGNQTTRDAYPGSQSIGLALTSDQTHRPISRVSMAPSSPSIYPASLAPSNTDSLNGDETETSSTPLHGNHVVSSVPPVMPPAAIIRRSPVESPERPPVFQVQSPSQILSREAPPIPRRSLRRPSTNKIADDSLDSPLTPLSAPSSVSSHTHSKPVTPDDGSMRRPAVHIWDQTQDSAAPQLRNPMDLLAKRTLLDVRPHPSREFASGNV
ncbi:hypothetical protein HGRIS_007954 [Hohenbuehelia grisea]|uniref:Uncharacterized protein n=1 Tax=Hohenbuehelia grisea TaxID=104357 RepID=A0ABR3J779_9AGAR